MRARLTMIAAILTCASAAAAEPPKTQAAPSGTPPKVPAQVVLASAETTHATTPGSVQPNAAPVKRRPVRVTTCRCGDQQVDPENQEQ
jgi:hypothetical protein